MGLFAPERLVVSQVDFDKFSGQIFWHLPVPDIYRNIAPVTVSIFVLGKTDFNDK